jgi:aspartate/methionine/tyrosine aminotransferase
MIQNYDNLISLTIGQPDFPTPSLVKEAAKRAITRIPEIWISFTLGLMNCSIVSPFLPFEN